MTNYVFCFLWCCIVTLVASKPAAQLLPQQGNYRNPVPYQAPASRTKPSNQNVKVQNQTPNLANFDGALLNDLLMTKILGNPSLQKILDPNTKLYKQNGQEIHRQPNPGVSPSVVNNYFIVPPEFFTIKNNKTGGKSKNKPRTETNSKKRKTPTNKSSNIKTQPKASKVNEKIKVGKDVEFINQIDTSRTKKKNKKLAEVKSAKLIEEDAKSNIKSKSDKPQELRKKTKRKRKRNESTKLELPVTPKEDTKVNIQNEEDVLPETNTTTAVKRRKKSKIKPEIKNPSIIQDTTISPEDLRQNIENIHIPVVEKPSTPEKKSKSAKLIEEPIIYSHLPAIEPLFNQENLLNRQLVEPPITIHNDSKTRTPTSEKTQITQASKKSHGDIVTNERKPKNSPVPDDVLKNYFPYMYMNNNFYQNSNYPFNFEQLFLPYLNSYNNAKNNKTTTRKNTNVKSKGSLPNVIEVKLKPKKQNIPTITEKPISAEIVEDSSSDTSVESAEFSDTQITVIDDLTKQKQTYEKKNELSEVNNTEISEDKHSPNTTDETSKEVTPPEFIIPKKETIAPKASLEMPPTVIEDLHDFMIPELGREDIMPTAHTNGIIADYYPIFNDDSYYENAQNFFLGDLEDERHFYTTDRGFEDLNRERRKYDKHEDYLNSNVDFLDHVNFRKAFKYRERDKPKYEATIKKDSSDHSHDHTVYKMKPHNEKMIEKNETLQENITEDKFQTPPLLENPDFQTRQIERISPVYDPNQHYSKSEPDIKPHVDKKPIGTGKLLFDTDFEEDQVSVVNNLKVSTTTKPTNDRIETVFAKTRVVKYGVAKGEERDISEHFPGKENGEDKFYSDGQTTYVLAKSLGKADDYFW